MKLIILTGAPASGKSSLSKALSERTSIEFVSKDDLKIGLFEQYGFTSHDQKKSLSKLSEKMLYERIKDSILKQRQKNKNLSRHTLKKTQAKYLPRRSTMVRLLKRTERLLSTAKRWMAL